MCISVWSSGVCSSDLDDGTVLGFAYATQFRERHAYRFAVETSVYVAGELQRNGVGRMLYEALIDTLAAQGFTQAIAAISLPNDASTKQIGRASWRERVVHLV